MCDPNDPNEVKIIESKFKFELFVELKRLVQLPQTYLKIFQTLIFKNKNNWFILNIHINSGICHRYQDLTLVDAYSIIDCDKTILY